MAEAEETLDRIGRTPFSKILRLQLNQERLDKPDFKGNFPQMMARPRKRETELLLGEVGPGRGLFSKFSAGWTGGRGGPRKELRVSKPSSATLSAGEPGWKSWQIVQPHSLFSAEKTMKRGEHLLL